MRCIIEISIGANGSLWYDGRLFQLNVCSAPENVEKVDILGSVVLKGAIQLYLIS